MRDRVVAQKQFAASGDHDRIDDERGKALTARSTLGERSGHRRHDFAGIKQAGLDRRDRKAFKKRFNLRTHDCGGNAADPDDFSRSFRDHTRDGGHSINPECAESFQIGLDTGAGAAIGTGDGQGDGDV